MRLCKVLLEISRSTSHMVEVPRYEVAVRRAVNPPETKFKIHTRPHSEVPVDSIMEFSDDMDAAYREAWRDLRGRFPKVAGEVFDAVTFRDEFEATVARDGLDVTQNPAELTHASWEPLMRIDEVDEALAQSLFAYGMQSVESVAGASLDELEAVPGSSVAKAVALQASARKICNYSPRVADDDDVSAMEEDYTAASAAMAVPEVESEPEPLHKSPTMEGLTADPVAPIEEPAPVAPASPFDLPPGD